MIDGPCNITQTEQQTYMDLPQQNYFRLVLEQWRDRLILEVQLSREQLKSDTDEGGDIIDRSVQDHQKMMNYITSSRHEKKLAQINAALRRLADGSYGYCLVSGEEIGLQRLRAYPLATLSVEMQEQLEKREKQRIRNYQMAE